MKHKIWKLILFLLTATVCAICLIYSKYTFDGISSGIQICITTLIPSMFCFMVISNFIANSSLCSILSRPFRPLARHLFKLDDRLFTVFLLSLLGGYPVGAKLLADKIRSGEIPVQTGQRMIYFCVNCSPAFIISGAAMVLWNSLALGAMIYASQVITCFVIAFACGFKKNILTVQDKKTATPPCSVALVQAVNNATKSMGIVCSFVVVFCAFFPFVNLLPLSDTAGTVLKGLLEVISGCQMIRDLPLVTSVLLVALFTSFGGICVHLQIMALLNGTGIKMGRFLLSRVCYTALSMGITWIGIQLLKPAVSCFNQIKSVSYHFYSVSPVSSLFLIFLAIMLLMLASSKKQCKHLN